MYDPVLHANHPGVPWDEKCLDIRMPRNVDELDRFIAYNEGTALRGDR
jgi:hypothetical protein